MASFNKLKMGLGPMSYHHLGALYGAYFPDEVRLYKWEIVEDDTLLGRILIHTTEIK